MPDPYNVLITRSAEEDIGQIWQYIANESAERASDFIARIEAQIHTLETYPKRCPVIAESEYLGIEYRHLIIGDYRIILRLEAHTVYIMRVIHGPRLLKI